MEFLARSGCGRFPWVEGIIVSLFGECDYLVILFTGVGEMVGLGGVGDVVLEDDIWLLVLDFIGCNVEDRVSVSSLILEVGRFGISV